MIFTCMEFISHEEMGYANGRNDDDNFYKVKELIDMVTSLNKVLNGVFIIYL